MLACAMWQTDRETNRQNYDGIYTLYSIACCRAQKRLNAIAMQRYQITENKLLRNKKYWTLTQ